jgi:outer membrane lipoprotein-sorting protein
MPAIDYRMIATAMNAHKHGGTLLIVPSDNGWRDSILKPIKFAGEPFFRTRYDVIRREQIKEKMNQETKERGPFLWTEDNRYKMATEAANKSLRSIGGLTAVDGATVITFDLDVLAFGVKIHPKSEDNKPETVLISEPFEGSEKREVKLSDLGGTRHQSAAQFAFDQKDALVFVASQDGRLSVMKWDKEKETVSVIRPAEYGLL